MAFGRVLTLLVSSLGGMDQEFYQDFRDSAGIHPILSLFGPDSAQATRPEPRGLRITLRAKRKETAAVGLAPQFPISGDFEITVGYEILGADVPAAGFGVGVKIWGEIKSDDDQKWMNLARLMRPGGERVFVAVLSRPAEGGKRKFQTETLPSDAARGRLRLARTGSELTALVAEGDRETFDELQRVEVGTGDVTKLRISATTSDDPCGLSMYLCDLRIRAEELRGAPRGSGGFGVWLVVWLLVIAALGTGGVLLWRHQRRLGKPKAARATRLSG